jgi:hypothetical protein
MVTRSNLRLCLVSAVDGTSIRFDIVLGSSGPRPTAPAGPSRRGYLARAADIYPPKIYLSGARGFWYSARSAIYSAWR